MKPKTTSLPNSGLQRASVEGYAQEQPGTRKCANCLRWFPASAMQRCDAAAALEIELCDQCVMAFADCREPLDRQVS